MSNSFYVDKDFNCPIPRTYWIELSAVCNSKCPFCATANGLYYNDVMFMDFETYRRIFDKIKKYARYIYLHRHGGPTLNREIWSSIG
jgi:sulfatase maturation enzyme AslB (radical SAM superfamily)